MNNPPRYNVPKGKTLNYMGQLIKNSKKTPGVASYDIRRKQKIMGSYRYDAPKAGFTDDIQSQAQSMPDFLKYEHIEMDKLQTK